MLYIDWKQWRNFCYCKIENCIEKTISKKCLCRFKSYGIYINEGICLEKIKLSDSYIEISAKMINEIKNSLDKGEYSYQVGQYHIVFKIIGEILGSKTVSIQLSGKNKIYMSGLFVSSNKETAEMMTNYLNTISETVNDLNKQALKAVIAEFTDVTGISYFSKTEAEEFLKDYVDFLKKKDMGMF